MLIGQAWVIYSFLDSGNADQPHQNCKALGEGEWYPHEIRVVVQKWIGY